MEGMFENNSGSFFQMAKENQGAQRHFVEEYCEQM